MLEIAAYPLLLPSMMLYSELLGLPNIGAYKLLWVLLRVIDIYSHLCMAISYGCYWPLWTPTIYSELYTSMYNYQLWVLLVAIGCYRLLHIRGVSIDSYLL